MIFSYQDLGREMEEQRLYHAALDCYAKARGASARLAAGRVLVKLGREEQAMASFKLALRQSPLDPDVHLQIGKCWVRLGNAVSAVRHFRRAQGF